MQVWDVTQSGYWHARSFDYTSGAGARFLEWMRMPGDVVFILFGALPLAIATLKAWIDGFRAAG
jgi:nitric oxide reductase subunit B